MIFMKLQIKLFEGIVLASGKSLIPAMKNTLHFITFAVLFSCVKENDKVSTQNITQNVELSATDSSKTAVIKNPDYSPAFEITPQDISPEQGRSVFTQNGKTLFYFDQNSNKGIINIDGKNYDLTRFDFNENNYTLSGNGVSIEASNGDFKDMVSDCVYGIFPQVKVAMDGKILNLTNISLQDCPAY